MSSNNTNIRNSDGVPDDLDIADSALTELKAQYNSLVEDIKTKHNEQQKLFSDMAVKKYDGEDYEQDKINHLIEANVSKLKEQRDKIWKYLSNKYNQNTKKIYRNLRTIKNNEIIIKEKQNAKEALAKQANDLTKQNSTQQRIIQNNIYQHKDINNKANVQFVIMIILAIDILVLYLSHAEYISQFFALLYVGLSGLFILLYFGYRIYVVRMNKDLHSWDKLYFNKIDSDIQATDKNTVNTDTTEKIDYAKLDKDAKSMFTQYKDSCK